MEVKEQHRRSMTNIEGESEGWLALWEVGREEGIQYTPENVPILLSIVASCEERDHEKPALAAEGHKQYFYHKKDMDKKQQTKEKSITGTAKAKIEDETEWKGITKSMETFQSSSARPKKQKATQLPAEPQTAKTAWFKDANQESKNLSKLLEKVSHQVLTLETKEEGIVHPAFLKPYQKLIQKAHKLQVEFIKLLVVSEDQPVKNFGKQGHNAKMLLDVMGVNADLDAAKEKLAKALQLKA